MVYLKRKEGPKEMCFDGERKNVHRLITYYLIKYAIWFRPCVL